MEEPIPLPTLLSHTLVAFTIEFDNESEHRMPHRTTNHGSSADGPHAPWLVSLVMWENCMRFAGERGVRVGELEMLARTTTNRKGMQRWGYVVIQPDPSDSRPKPPHRDWLIRATPGGRKAREILEPLFDTIEERWQTRFGEEQIGQLRESLGILIDQIDPGLPDCLPILGYGLFSKAPSPKRPEPPPRKDGTTTKLSLSALLSRVLLAFAIEFERESDLSLAMCANALRVLNDEGVPVRELPRLTGVSKELIKVSLGFLQKYSYVVIAADPNSKAVKMVQLTAKGVKAQATYRKRLSGIEKLWMERFGAPAIRGLRVSLERLVIGSGKGPSPLFQGLIPHPEGWRASVRRPDTLPHYPMVTHRGGFPDGS
jgi:DNA-binding MarR family transcriptional regulator